GVGLIGVVLLVLILLSVLLVWILRVLFVFLVRFLIVLVTLFVVLLVVLGLVLLGGLALVFVLYFVLLRHVHDELVFFRLADVGLRVVVIIFGLQPELHTVAYADGAGRDELGDVDEVEVLDRLHECAVVESECFRLTELLRWKSAVAANVLDHHVQRDFGNAEIIAHSAHQLLHAVGRDAQHVLRRRAVQLLGLSDLHGRGV